MANTTVPPRAKRRGRRLLFVAFAILFGLIGAVLATEIALRIYDPLHLPLEDMRGFYRLDEKGRIETVPGWTGAQIVPGLPVPVPVNMNALGLRGPEIGPRTPGEKRVLMLGDSFVWGQGVIDGATVPARLEAALRDAGRNVTVGNAGMFATGPREWGYTLERFRGSFDPDLVVAVMYVGNDVLNSLMEPLSVEDGWLMISGTTKLRESWRFRLMLSSRLWYHVEHLFAEDRLENMVNTALGQYRPGIPFRPDDAVFLDRDPALDPKEPFFGRIEAVMTEMFRDFAKAARGLPTLVVLLPGHEVALRDYGELLKEYGLDPAVHERGGGHARLTRLLAAEGFEVIDLAPQFFAAEDPRSLFLPLDWHFSEKGCEQVAQWLLPEVEKRLAR